MQWFGIAAFAAIGAEAFRSPHLPKLPHPPNARHVAINRMASAHAQEELKKIDKRDIYPAPITDYKVIHSPANLTIRYKETKGFCETTPGVNSYSGYIDLGQDMHSYFWFFESRRDPKNDPVTLWLNGGPGSDSLIGLLQELGPCNITDDLKTQLNPYAWNEVSNMFFLSQPYGTGFSYQHEAKGSLSNVTGELVYADKAPPDGRWPVIDVYNINTTDAAAHAAWNVVQGFYSALPQLDGGVQSNEFNLYTESYGGHYGPSFFHYFQQQNEMIAKHKLPGKHLDMISLGIINGIISEKIQAPEYPRFAVNNTFGIKAYNETVYNQAMFSLTMPSGCLDQVDLCSQVDPSTITGQAICSEAQCMCRDSVEGLYYAFSGRGTYDIRHPAQDPTPPDNMTPWLNLPHVQQALGVNLNYTSSNTDTYYVFQLTGDFVYPTFLQDLGDIIDSGVHVAMLYGDADYICNWFGGQAVSIHVPHKNQKRFQEAGYTPFIVDGVQRGETRQVDNFSFTRIYESGHEVPYYQPEGALAWFNRNIHGLDIALGKVKTGDKYCTNGTAETTHTESYVPLPSKTAMASSGANVKDRIRLG